MCVDRRGFMQVAAGAAGASLLVSRRASSEEAPLPKSLESLSSMVTDIEPITDEERKGRIANAQRLMKENGLGAVYLESGSTLFYYTGVRWGQSERMFAMVMPAMGEPAYVCPAFEEERARERIRFGDDIRTWEEHESPYKLVAQIFADRGVRTGKVGIEERTRFFFVESGAHRQCSTLDERERSRRRLSRVRVNAFLLHRRALGPERAHVRHGEVSTRNIPASSS